MWTSVVLVTLVAVGQWRHPVSAGGNKLQMTDAWAQNFLDWFEVEATDLCNKNNVASWNYDSNITDATQELSIEASVNSSKFYNNIWKNITQYDWESLKNDSLKRMIRRFTNIGVSALSDDKTKLFSNLVTKMSGIYGATKVCNYTNSSDCGLHLDPDITARMSNSHDYDELAYYWKQWHDKVGRSCKPLYRQYVEIGNEAAKANGLHDYGDLYRGEYGTETLERDVAKLWDQLRPFYLQLHAYVRKKLVEKYGANKVSRMGPIPAHLLGNMWSQQWDGTFDFTKPFNVTVATVDGALVKQGYTPNKMFRTAESFYVGLGLEPMFPDFWNRSIIERPRDGRDVVCHASAWDFCNGKDFRIKMCTVVGQEDFITIHHEMGHIEYFMQYRHQPFLFREGANPGFHEAIGDTISLSVSTNKHLEWLKLLPEESSSKESDLNFLFQKALEKIAFLPFGYAMDYYRWRLFRGDIPEDSWNTEWWKIRLDLQGIIPPFPRTEDDFDPAAKYHTIADVEYMRYFISFVLQFQFHKALCIKAGQYIPNDHNKPLHQCDINLNKKAGTAFSEMLRLGSSKPWPEILKQLTGSDKMDAEPIMEYFRPLMEFLQQDNKKTGEKIGWN